MWVWIIISVIVVAGLVAALWPRRRGVDDAKLLSARRSTEGRMEGINSSNQRNWPTGG